MADETQTPGQKKVEDDLNAVDKDPDMVGGDSAGSSGSTTGSAGSTDSTTSTTGAADVDDKRDKDRRDNFEKKHGDQGY